MTLRGPGDMVRRLERLLNEVARETRTNGNATVLKFVARRPVRKRRADRRRPRAARKR
jgi:hypothetical protein